MQPLLVILDLDETLIYGTTSPPDTHWDFAVGPYKIYKRPWLTEFLEKLGTYFNVAVWSSASDDYVKEVVQNIFPPDYNLLFVWGRSKCTRQFDYKRIAEWGRTDDYEHLLYVKHLKKVKQKGFAPLEKILIIDDTPSKSIHNYGNAIYPTEFKGDPKDNELVLLWKYLLTLEKVDNVRSVEKRSWKSTISLGDNHT